MFESLEDGKASVLIIESEERGTLLSKDIIVIASMRLENTKISHQLR